MTPIAIAYGSNLGSSAETIERALGLISEFVRNMRRSALYLSKPMYFEAQPPFLNGALIGETDCSPGETLWRMKRIEVRLGRRPGRRNGPREIDLDLVAYGALRYRWFAGDVTSEPKLEIPHPRAAERRFVLQPLADLDTELPLPGIGAVGELLSRPSVASQWLEVADFAGV